MNDPLPVLTETPDGWQAVFAFQVFHRSGEDWIKMRWGFNAGALLEEAIDRQKLFIESQAASDEEFRSGIQPVRTLALRGMQVAGVGLQISVLGKTSAATKQEVQRSAQNYAREIQSIFPHDFILIPAETLEAFQRLAGHDLLSAQVEVAQIQRGFLSLPPPINQRFQGLWQVSARSNEQIWRALSALPFAAILNVLLRPTFLYEVEKNLLHEVQDQISNEALRLDPKTGSVQWLESLSKRRLGSWRRFFLLQVHVIAENEVDESLLRSIGSALTRDTNEVPLPGFRIDRPDSNSTAEAWRATILTLDFIPGSRADDLVDLNEAHAVFRFPYRPEHGLPGANFMKYPAPSLPRESSQGS